MIRSLPVRAYLEQCIVSDGQEEKYLPGPHQFSAFTAGEGISLLSLSWFAFFFYILLGDGGCYSPVKGSWCCWTGDESTSRRRPDAKSSLDTLSLSLSTWKLEGLLLIPFIEAVKRATEMNNAAICPLWSWRHSRKQPSRAGFSALRVKALFF